MANRLASRWRRFQAAFIGLTAGAILAAAASPAHAFSWGWDNNGIPMPLSNLTAREGCVTNGVVPWYTTDSVPNYWDSPYSNSCLTMPDLGFYNGAGGAAIQDVDVSIRIRHPRIRDLVILLRHRDYSNKDIVIPLMVQAGCQPNDFPPETTFGRDLSIYFDDEAPASVDFSCDRTIPELHGRLAPTGVSAYTSKLGLLQFNGMTIGGLWKLEVQDYGTTGSEGAILEWQLHFNGLVEGDGAPREEAPTAPDTQSGNNIVTETDYVVTAYHLLGINEFDHRVMSGQPDNLMAGVGSTRTADDYVDTRRSSGSEFTRIDCAPASSNGDGTISVADFVQTNRYAASVDALVPANIGPLSKDDRMLFAYPTEGTVFVRGEPRDVPVSIMMRTKQAETEVGFGLNFNPDLLEFVRVERGACIPANAIFQVSREVELPGLVGVRVGVDPDSTFECDFTPARPILGTGGVDSPTALGTVIPELSAIRPLAQTATLTSIYRPIDFTTAFPTVTVDFYLDNPSGIVVKDYRFDIDIPNDKLTVIGTGAGAFGVAPEVDELSRENVSSDYKFDSTYKVVGSNASSTFVSGLLATVKFYVTPGAGLFSGVEYDTSYRMPSLRLAKPESEVVTSPDGSFRYVTTVLNRVIGNTFASKFVSVNFDDDDTLEIRSGIDNPPYRVGTPLPSVELAPVSLAGDDPEDPTDDINPCLKTSTVLVDVVVTNNVRSPGIYLFELVFDPKKFSYSNQGAYSDGGYGGVPTIAYTANEGSLRVMAIRSVQPPNGGDTFLNGTIARLGFDIQKNLIAGEDNSIVLRSATFEVASDTTIEPNLAGMPNKVTFCPGAVATIAPTKISAKAEETRLAMEALEPAAPAAASTRKGIPPSPVADATIGARLVDITEDSGVTRIKVGVEVPLNAPAVDVTSYAFDLTYDATVIRPICGTVVDGGAGFNALPTILYQDITNDASADDDCFVRTGAIADAFRALPNEPTSNYRTLTVDGRNAGSTFQTGTLFTMDFEVLDVSASEVTMHITTKQPVNKNVEVAKAYFRAKEGTGTVATPLVFGPNPFADGLAARNPLGSPIYMSFIDSGVTIVDPSLPRPTVRIVDTVLKSDDIGTVQIALDSVGVETAAGFTLSYNPADIQLLSVSRGRDVHPSGFFYTEPNENSVAEANATGKLRMLISLQPGAAPGPAQTFQRGTRILANLRFKTRKLTPDESLLQAIKTNLTFEKLADKREVCDAFAIPLETRFPVGTISISAESCKYVVAPTSREFQVIGRESGDPSTAPPDADSTITVAVVSGCPWVASTTADWITLNPSTISGFGDGVVRYRVAENTGPARSAEIEVGGKVHTITQLACAYSLNADNDTFPGDASVGSFSVDTSSICDWRVETADTWIQITSDRFMIGPGNVEYSVDANVGLPRSGTITVRGGGGQILNYTVNQVICKYTLAPKISELIPAVGGNGKFAVSAPTACPWTATVQGGASWVTITGGSAGRGPGEVAFSVSPITTKAGRTATIVVGDQSFKVRQDGCRYDLASTTEQLPPSPNKVIIHLATDPSCVWAASVDQTWATLETATGAGSADITMDVAANTTGLLRTVSFTLEGTTLSFTQDFCRYTLSPSTVDLQPAASNGTIGLSVNDGGCPWTVSVNQPWVSILTPLTGVGNSNINYRVTANTTGATRVAEVRLNDQKVTITQVSCAFSIAPAEAFVPSTGGIATFRLTTDDGCPWHVATTAEWITILNPDGFGPATITLDVDANFDEARDATITIGDKTSHVRQFKRNQFGFDFGTDASGWEYSGAGGFTSPVGEASDGALNISLSDNKNSFGFWRSPLLKLDDATQAGTIYLLTATVKTNLEQQTTVPPIRFRISSADFSQTNELWAVSNGNGAFSPSLANPRGYRHLFTLPTGTSQFRVYFDVLGLVAQDAASATLSLDQVIVQTSPYSLASARNERLFLLADSSAGWTTGGSPDFTMPVFAKGVRGLTIMAADPNNVPPKTIFGFWNNNSDLRLELNRAYRANFKISARSIRGPEVQKALVPPFRMRLNTSTFRAASVVNIDSRNVNSPVPGFLEPQEYTVWLVAEEELAGDRLFFAFDYLLPAASQDDPAVELILEQLDVTSFPVPSVN